MKKFQFLLLGLILMLLQYDCKKENLDDEVGTIIPKEYFGWYRGVIPAHKISFGNITTIVEKSLVYIHIIDGYSTLFHAAKVDNFIANGLLTYSEESNPEKGTISGEFSDKTSQTGYYEIFFKKISDDTYEFTLRGFSGQPDVILKKIENEVTPESFLDDVGKTLF